MRGQNSHKRFYWRAVADDFLLVCLECERECGDSAGACTVQLVSVKKSIFIFCYRCGKKERLFCLACGEREKLTI